MKRLFFLILIICLPVITYFQYVKWRKFHPPAAYTYVTANPDSLDLSYYNSDLVKNYYQYAQESGTLARGLWNTYGIDVKAPDLEETEHREQVQYYNFLVAECRRIEQLLKRSYQLKKQGLTNNNIRGIFRGSYAVAEIKNFDKIKDLSDLKFGDESQEVYDLQKLLNAAGYETPIDGKFRDATREVLKKYQQENDLAPLGFTNTQTIRKLLKIEE